MNEIRLLKSSEIECRVGQCGKSQKGVAWCSLLLYKDARCDMKVMDETFGPMGWQKSYELINGNLFCTVSVRSEDGEWISKQDVGVESNTEKEKGQASDAFKRACVNWGVGRELYTAPKIFVTLKDGETVERNGKMALAPKVVFTVTEIDFDDKRTISALTIVDNNGVVRYKLGQVVSPKESDDEAEDQMAYAIPAIEQAQTHEELTRIYNDYPKLQGNTDFTNALNNRYKELTSEA